MLYLFGAAMAGIPVLEEELAEEAAFAVLAEVVESECLSVLEDGTGISNESYRAVLSVSEVLAGEDVPAELTLLSDVTRYPDDRMPDCASTEYAHPVGEVARYYLRADGEDSFREHVGGSFFPTEDSAPLDWPECPDLSEPSSEPSSEGGDEASAGEDSGDGGGDGEKAGCSAVPAGGGFWSICLLAAAALRRRAFTL